LEQPPYSQSHNHTPRTTINSRTAIHRIPTPIIIIIIIIIIISVSCLSPLSPFQPLQIDIRLRRIPDTDAAFPAQLQTRCGGLMDAGTEAFGSV
jgi:hypothetical protein